MKKSLTALAVLGVFAGSAMAADVTLYGAIDTGLEYIHNKTTDFAGDSVKEDKFDMQNGWDTPSRWGLKGSEDLGNGYKVSFKLESGFSSDDGTMNQSGRLFGREAGLTLSGPFGSVAFGRFGGISSSAGTYDPKSRSKPSRYSSENDVLIEKSVKYTDFFLLSIVYV